MSATVLESPDAFLLIPFFPFSYCNLGSEFTMTQSNVCVQPET